MPPRRALPLLCPRSNQSIPPPRHHVRFGYHGQNIPADAAVGGNQLSIGTFLKAEGDYCLSVRDGNVLLAPSTPRGEHQDQEWFKFMRFSAPIQDDGGNPAFFLVNKANGLALENTFGQFDPMVLVPFNPAYLDESVMWTEAGDVGDGFRYIRALKLNNTRLNNDQGGVHHGTTVVLWEGAKGDNQIWKILPWGKEAYGGGGSPGPTVRIFCKADEGFSATVRNGAVVLEPTNPRDECQYWFKDTRHGNRVTDEEGYPAFALVNKFTGKAIKHSQSEGHPVELVKYKYSPNYPDESVLWTESPDVGAGFRCIRMANNIRLNFGALNGKMKMKGKATKHSQCFGHPIRNHYCPSCLQKRVCRLLKLR